MKSAQTYRTVRSAEKQIRKKNSSFRCLAGLFRFFPRCMPGPATGRRTAARGEQPLGAWGLRGSTRRCPAERKTDRGRPGPQGSASYESSKTSPQELVPSPLNNSATTDPMLPKSQAFFRIAGTRTKNFAILRVRPSAGHATGTFAL